MAAFYALWSVERDALLGFAAVFPKLFCWLMLATSSISVNYVIMSALLPS